MKARNSTQKTLLLLLSGKSSAAKRFAGKHVLVVEDKVVPLKKGEEGWKDFMRLEKKYGQPPIVVFVPRQDISYIFF
ncbi:MAG: hypothetical protein COZ37_01775 [bacterium (Candidatus Ratteibacteria) CG_4_10_14_3_um_filter_41_18]|uniref:DUF5678 domain-containing protein n=3 Tax=Candidatus Ratteibacteria TaxID=2979319 RepID=A0A2M7YFE0_9BACT|nr:MAG: hypothetical protein AUJ76_02370 [Candidatus Omnitrophica bacterium CG1_02_41_171]PIW33909.1 MAG: hypothetical protein COW28_02070 [bacterium (Candidatus Ratteibacteria) CG15_BIG_FIL_POST_REV_8_21_14_020_41_12]PIX77618.1 MAG: hypothetical protein COZ37_01775 [bacterium (Candidatus Ratteibacteria) CG_4_10_14_3_um_filter_41_18]PJA61679.1 MAG: hypothetical protein CO162_05055 [bacterium (Candidatus Ratteibacteria) CG_4_9_14_3_um_filter_41_21]HCG77180.1 hypothetical protein [bacterium]